jgi:hypothetical protein
MNPYAVFGTNLADLPPGTHRQQIAEGTRVEPEQHGSGIVHVQAVSSVSKALGILCDHLSLSDRIWER